MRILSVDPGLSFTGWAIIEKDEISIQLLAYDVIKLKQSNTIRQKIHEIYFKLFEIIHNNHIDRIAFETSFLGINAATYLKLGYIRSLLYLLAEIHGLPHSEFSPKEVKKIITGTGNSDKEAVLKRIRRQFPDLGVVEKYDISDAIAIGLCALRTL